MMTPPLPLFNWQQLTEAERLQCDRERLLNRIQSLKPHAHRRIALEERLRQMTLRQLALASLIYRKPT